MLEVAGDPLIAADLRKLSGLSPTERATELDDDGRTKLMEIYRQRTKQQLLLLELLSSADPELRQEAEEHLREQGLSQLVDETLQKEMWQLVDSDPEELLQYYEDNRTNYQSPLRFKLVAWDLPFDDNPPRQLEQMEELHGALIAGELDLDAAAGRLGGSIRKLGWRGFDDLPREIPNKARTYLLAGDGVFSVPYQQDDTLHLLWVEAREEPRPLEYEEVVEQVRKDYFNRFRQRLYRQVADVRLAAAGFLFHEDALRRLLASQSESS